MQYKLFLLWQSFSIYKHSILRRALPWKQPRKVVQMQWCIWQQWQPFTPSFRGVTQEQWSPAWSPAWCSSKDVTYHNALESALEKLQSRLWIGAQFELALATTKPMHLYAERNNIGCFIGCFIIFSLIVLLIVFLIVFIVIFIVNCIVYFDSK